MRNKVEYSLKDSQKFASQLKECSDSKGAQSGLNVRVFKYHIGVRRFHILLQSYKLSHGLCLNSFPQVLLLGNQRDQVLPIR